MAIDPSGSISEAEDACMDLLAGLAAFQTWAGVETAAAAKAKLYNDWAPLDAARPYGWASLVEFDSIEVAEGQWDQTGVCHVILERLVPEAYEESIADAERDLKNAVGAMVDEMYGATPGVALNVQRIEVSPAYRAGEDDEANGLGQIQAIELRLHWVS